MVLEFDVQMGVTKIPDLTADGRDGFSSRAQHDWCVERYLGGMCDKKRGKALIVSRSDLTLNFGGSHYLIIQIMLDLILGQKHV